jgi:ADP-ribose pyrophosphatase
MKTWEMLQSREIISDRWLKLTADQCRLPTGQIIDPYYVVHESDWVHIFAFDNDGHLLVVRQFRYAANVECVELPGGVIDKGEEPLAAAQRELLEENGHTANMACYRPDVREPCAANKFYSSFFSQRAIERRRTKS